VKPVRAGLLRNKVTLQAPAASETFDSFSQPIQSWTTIGTFFAWIRPLMGREAVVAKQVKAEATHGITMNWLGSSVSPNPTYQILYNGRVFGIIQVINVEERNIQYDIIAQEIQQTGQV
jgi:head-tail adaptor